MDTLAEQYIPLAQKRARFYTQKFYTTTYDELEAIAFSALVEAERTFEREKGYGFAAYAQGVIHHKILDHAKKVIFPTTSFSEYANILGKHGNDPDSIDSQYSIDNYNESDAFATEEEAFAAIEFFEDFRVFLKTLKKDEQYLVYIRVNDQELTQKQCAERLSERFRIVYSQATISNMLKRVQTKYLQYQQDQECAV